MQELTYTTIRGRPCRIMWAKRNPAERNLGESNLYVRNLPVEVTERELFLAFGAFGSVLSVKMPKSEGKQLGFAFVHYDAKAAADTAMTEMNGCEFPANSGYCIKVEPYLRKTERSLGKKWTNVYVRGVPAAWNVAALESVFAKFGEITSVALAAKPTEHGGGKSVPAMMASSGGVGFVNFRNQESADKAIAALDGVEFDDGPLANAAPGVKAALPIAAPAAAAAVLGAAAAAGAGADVDASVSQVGAAVAAPEIAATASTASTEPVAAMATPTEASALAATGVVPAAAVDALAAAINTLAIVGAVEACVPEAASTAVVAVAAPEAAAPAAPLPLPTSTANKVTLHVMRHLTEADRLRQKAIKLKSFKKDSALANLYVRYLPTTFTENKLMTLFATYGTVSGCHLVKDGEKVTGAAFVSFSARAEAESALNALHGHRFNDERGPPLLVAWQESKETRQARLAQEMTGSDRSGWPSAGARPGAGYQPQMNFFGNMPGGMPMVMPTMYQMIQQMQNMGMGGMGMAGPGPGMVMGAGGPPGMMPGMMPPGMPPGMPQGMPQGMLMPHQQQQPQGGPGGGVAGGDASARGPATYFAQPPSIQHQMHQMQGGYSRGGNVAAGGIPRPMGGPVGSQQQQMAGGPGVGPGPGFGGPRPSGAWPMAPPRQMLPGGGGLGAPPGGLGGYGAPPGGGMGAYGVPPPGYGGPGAPPGGRPGQGFSHPTPGFAQPPPARAAPQRSAANRERVIADAHATNDKEKRHNLLGEYLYPIVQLAYPELAGKITGMILAQEFLDIVASIQESALDNKMNEAYNVLMEARRGGA